MDVYAWELKRRGLVKKMNLQITAKFVAWKDFRSDKSERNEETGQRQTDHQINTVYMEALHLVWKDFRSDRE